MKITPNENVSDFETDLTKRGSWGRCKGVGISNMVETV